jgi:glyoxylase-like metal-dependent hydrolase (beta-lactamase superfamily II)
MKLYTINTGYFKLDGGAMFGVVPKVIWSRLHPADENNLCNWAMRCMLVQDGDKLILIDTGIGDKQDDKFFGYYYLNGNDSLEKSLNDNGFSRDDITDVLHTHLHFDHCGGSIIWNNNKTGYEPAFKNATYWTHQKQWEHALNPNPREKASFLKENLLPMQEASALKFVGDDLRISDNVSAFLGYGHTEAMMMPKIQYGDKTIVFMADLMPSINHIKPSYAMGYDIRPLDTMAEREAFNKEAIENNYILFFEHDPVNECATLKQTERGPKVDRTFKLSEI